ncbi:MAG: quinone-dependent dihydroorotate dehydrogenase [Chitinophagales bacterium]|nr:quinone-dependent dihydroorotate dehydrogenase [Chitinophagales bacterium]
MYRQVIKPIFFLFSPEKAHHLTMALLKLTLAIPGMKWLFKRWFVLEDQRLEVEVAGLKFPNRVGLAAGFDKDGKYFESLAYLGFGSIEIGTVTPLGQPGNDAPRLFRIPKHEALINRMGFNNDGVLAMAARLKQRKGNGIIIGGNIGKNKATPNDQAASDYVRCFEALYDHVDYFVVNVSSPNTPGLRELQEKAPLQKLLHELMVMNQAKPVLRPIFLKIAPDLTNAQLDDILEIVQTTKIHGVIATNTTLDRSKLTISTEDIGAGGLSGRPLTERSTEVIRYLYDKSGKTLDIIGVGGIASAQDAIDKIQAGAKLVQVYTGMIYEGPGLMKKINASFLDTNLLETP